MNLVTDIKEFFSQESELTTLRDLFVHGLKDIYYGEKYLLDALATMSTNASSTSLKQAFSEHLDETRIHVQRLEQIFEMIGIEPEAETCEAIEGLVAEAEDLIAEADKDTIDAALIFAAQGVEHYEMARYGTLRAWAEQLGIHEAAALLEQTLQEEKAADTLLNRLAEGGINQAAVTSLGRGSGSSTGQSAHF